MNMIRSRPLELVLIIDLNERNGNITNINDLRTAAMAVLDSLTRQDKVSCLSLSRPAAPLQCILYDHFTGLLADMCVVFCVFILSSLNKKLSFLSLYVNTCWY